MDELERITEEKLLFALRFSLEAASHQLQAAS